MIDVAIVMIDDEEWTWSEEGIPTSMRGVVYLGWRVVWRTFGMWEDGDCDKNHESKEYVKSIIIWSYMYQNHSDFSPSDEAIASRGNNDMHNYHVIWILSSAKDILMSTFESDCKDTCNVMLC